MVGTPLVWACTQGLRPTAPSAQPAEAVGDGVCDGACFCPFRPAGEALGSSGAPQMRSLSAANSSLSSGASVPSGLARQNSTSLTGKPGALPANLDDMKVSGHPFPTGRLQPLPTWPPQGCRVFVFRENGWLCSLVEVIGPCFQGLPGPRHL